MPTNQKITATFSEAMNPATILAAGTFTIAGPGATPVSGTVTYDAANNIAIFAPTAGVFAVSTTFIATITTAAKSFPGALPLASNYLWTFKTGASLDTTAPSVLTTNPVDLASTVATNQKITAAFNDAMDSTTISTSTFTLTGPGATPVLGTVTYAIIGTTATFTPSSALIPNTMYSATITTGAMDLAGNAVTGSFAWTFTTGPTTDTAAPSITSTNPAAGVIDVALNASINATFAEAMNSATLNPATFKVTGPGAAVVAGKVTYDVLDNIATFTPATALASSTAFTATLTTGAQDLSGNPLASDLVWTFTTGITPGLSPIDLGAATNFAVFAEATITNVVSAGTLVNGDLGLTPGTSVTGFPPGTVNGTIQIANPPAAAALADLGTAYGIAAGLSSPTIIAEDLGTQVLLPGLYQSAANSFEITSGNLTLDAQGDPGAVFIFQMPASTLTLTTGTCNVLLINGAQAANIFWQVGSSATIGIGCILEGSILANTSITLNGGATINGRSLAGAITATGAQTMHSNQVNLPLCN